MAGHNGPEASSAAAFAHLTIARHVRRSSDGETLLSEAFAREEIEGVDVSTLPADQARA